MSAFVVSTETMQRVVETICARNRYGQIVPHFDGIETAEPTAPTEIGRRLFTINVEAIWQRYPDTQENPDNMPGPCENGKSTAMRDAANFKAKNFTRSPFGSRIAGLKAMQCLSYQCAEGDVPESKLYAELERAIGEVAQSIVRSLPEYDNAAWG